MGEHNELDVLNETNYIDVLKEVLETFMNEASTVILAMSRKARITIIYILQV